MAGTDKNAARPEGDHTVKDKRNDSKKMIMIMSIVIGAVLICVIVVMIMLLFSSVNGGVSVPNGHVLKLKVGNGTISNETLASTKSVLQDRFYEYDSKAVLNATRDEQGNAYIFVRYASISYSDASSLAATGQFEMRIPTNGSDSAYVLNASDIKSVSGPTSQTLGDGSTSWSISLMFNDTGSQKFRQAIMDSGAANDSENHSIMMLLDGQVLYSKPLAPDLAKEIAKAPVDSVQAMIGTGDEGKAEAAKINVLIRSGPLPVGTEIVSYGS